jgi:hypothetical protein
VRFVRFQEVERTQQMADMGAKRSGKSQPNVEWRLSELPIQKQTFAVRRLNRQDRPMLCENTEP